MKKYFVALLVALLLFFCFNYFTKDELSKFTYYVYGQINSFKPSGSCFFIRKEGHIFLITNKHVVSGCMDGKIVPNFPDYMYVQFNGTDKKLAINSAKIRDTVKCDDDDLYIEEVDKSFSPYINSVEEYLKPITDEGQVVVYGYQPEDNQFGNHPPILKTEIPDDKYIIKAALGMVSKKFTPYYLSIKLDGDVEFRDIHGYSGSPLFIKDIDDKKWKIKGVLSAQVPIQGGTRIFIVSDSLLYWKLQATH